MKVRAGPEVDERLFGDCKQAFGVLPVLDLLDAGELPAAVAEEEPAVFFLGS